ncbi:hypothetical protein CRG98_011805 [Punica granatum]|uniref:Retrotransposon gag domain-containing protein n=1 Tax=Punica granatum TaxID=22663 RepID=A0A2I0KH30_PUNGR|nr:hypothetical protein CRG98_011805 [Punica granatum]
MRPFLPSLGPTLLSNGHRVQRDVGFTFMFFSSRDYNWRRTVIRLINVSEWRKKTELTSPRKSTHQFRLFLNHLQHMLRCLPFLQAYSRRTRAPLLRISSPDVFRSAPCTGLIDALRLRRPSPHRGTRGHGQPNGHQHGRAACPTQGIQPSFFELHASTRTGADGRSNPVGSTNSSPGEHGGARTTNTAHVRSSLLHQPIFAAAGPHGRPSSTDDLPILGARLVRPSARFHTGPGYGLHSTSADGFPGVQRTCSDSSSSRGASPLSVSTASCRPLLPGTAPHKHHLPRTGHADSCGPVRLTDAFLLRGRRRTGALFPGMRLPPKFKVPEFKTYEGTTDPRHHLRHYRGKMLPYWEYEEFVIHSFQDSLSGSALDWFMSLKAEDIPTWEDLSRRFTDQYRYCAETPPTLLELSTKEMVRGQRFE